MSFVSIYTVGRLKHPYEHPASVEFSKVGNEVYGQAQMSGDLIKEFPFSPTRIRIPQDAVKGEGPPVLTLTVWKSMDALYRFTYSGLHRQALRERNKWMESYPEKHLSYVVWWTEKLQDVSWTEGFKRYEYYTQNGPSPYAFDFKQAFDEIGEPYTVKK